jgi:hypothetical protein
MKLIRWIKVIPENETPLALSLAAVASAAILTGLILWSYWLQFHPAFVSGLTGSNFSKRSFALKKGDDRQWNLYEAGEQVGVAELDEASSAGRFLFKVVSTTSSALPQGRRFEITGLAGGFTCEKCLMSTNPNGQHALPVFWGLE